MQTKPPRLTDLAMWQTPQAPPHCPSTCKATVGRLRNITTPGLHVIMTMWGLEIYKLDNIPHAWLRPYQRSADTEHEMAGIVTRKAAQQLGKALAPPSSAPKVLPLITITVTIAQQYPTEPNTPDGGMRRNFPSEKRPSASQAATGIACFLFATKESLPQWDVNGSSRWLDLQPG